MKEFRIYIEYTLNPEPLVLHIREEREIDRQMMIMMMMMMMMVMMMVVVVMIMIIILIMMMTMIVFCIRNSKFVHLLPIQSV
jgi:hypothetical protein